METAGSPLSHTRLVCNPQPFRLIVPPESRTQSEDQHLGKWPNCQHRTCAGMRAGSGEKDTRLGGSFGGRFYRRFSSSSLEVTKCPTSSSEPLEKEVEGRERGEGQRSASPMDLDLKLCRDCSRRRLLRRRGRVQRLAGRWRRTLVLLQRLEATS